MSSGAAGEALGILRRLTGDPAAQFRPGQIEAIEAAVIRRERVLVVQRTGWGKSAVYFVATRMLRDRGAGPTLLLSPLLALMRNQVDAAARAGVRAEAMSSANTDDWDAILEDLAADRIDLLLVTEMRLANERFRDTYLPVLGRRTGLLVVDEVHCISDWGHDFRPHYRRIARFLDLLPSTVPVIGCTATANDRVVADVQAQLGTNLTTVRGPLGRDGLSLQCLDLPRVEDRLAWLAQWLPHLPGTGIVYCLTVHDVGLVAGFLAAQGFAVRGYTGQDEGSEREEVERLLLDNAVKVVVATSALGMGFDKPDLGFVVHYQMPGTPIAYYQQVGRAGRALDASYAVGLRGVEDEHIQDWFINTAFPERADAEAVVELLTASEEPLGVNDVLPYVNVRKSRLESMLVQLEVDGAIERTGTKWRRTLAPWAYPQERVDAVTAQRRHEQEVMRAYARSPMCRMRYLRLALDDHEATDCGICDRCGHEFGRGPLDPALVAAARAYLGRQWAWREPRKRMPAGMGGLIPEPERVVTITALCRWGDPVWGDAIQRGKYTDERFGDELVDALAAVLAERRLDPAPAWVTCVPSRRAPTLVPDFAKRLAGRLGLAWHEAVVKVRDTEPQKTQENTPRQARNVAGAFAVEGPLPAGPVLLVDDVVDSGWTVTTIARALVQAGSGPVHVAVLADAQGS